MELTDKLRLKKDVPLLLIGVPANIASLFEAFTRQKKNGQVAQVLFFVQRSQDLGRGVNELIDGLTDDAVFWIAYPKKSGSIASDLNRDDSWKDVNALGYEPVTAAAIDKDWTALRFRKKEAIGGYIRAVPMEERQAEGIDFKNRTVVLPADALAEVNKHEEMSTFFDGMSFSHKKEYVMAIAEAKRPGTRVKRIEKMVAMLHEKMQSKKRK